jgi:hypothetical protein
MSEQDNVSETPEAQHVPTTVPETSPELPAPPMEASDFFGSHFSNFIKDGKVDEGTLASLAQQHSMQLADARRSYDAYRAQRMDMVSELHSRAGGQDAWREATQWFNGAPEEVFTAKQKAELAQAIRHQDPAIRGLAVDMIVQAHRQHGGTNTVNSAVPASMTNNPNSAPLGDMMTPDELLDMAAKSPGSFLDVVERQIARGGGIL